MHKHIWIHIKQGTHNIIDKNEKLPISISVTEMNRECLNVWFHSSGYFMFRSQSRETFTLVSVFLSPSIVAAGEGGGGCVLRPDRTRAFLHFVSFRSFLLFRWCSWMLLFTLSATPRPFPEAVQQETKTYILFFILCSKPILYYFFFDKAMFWYAPAGEHWQAQVQGGVQGNRNHASRGIRHCAAREALAAPTDIHLAA